jgi:hypothetical protein
MRTEKVTLPELEGLIRAYEKGVARDPNNKLVEDTLAALLELWALRKLEPSPVVLNPQNGEI